MAVSINTGGIYRVVRASNADSLTGWALRALAGSGGTPAVFASVGSVDLVREGTDAVATVVNRRRIQIYYTNNSGYDFTSGSTGAGSIKVPNGLPYVWANFLASGSALTQANGGLQLTLGNNGNTRFYNVGGSDTYTGDWRKWSVDPVNAAVTGNTNLGNITEIGFVADVGNTTTRFDNFVVDAIDIGNGLTFQGTTVSNALFRESANADAATAIGVTSIFNGIIFAQGNLAFTGTAQTSVGETLVFTDTLLTPYIYNLDITGTVTLTNSSVLAAGTASFNFDSSSATSLIMNGGAVNGFNTLTTGVGQTTDGVVFSNGNTSTIANNVVASTFNQCGNITLTGSLTGCTINNATGTVGVTASTLNDVSDCSFISDGTGYAIDLGTISSSQSMTWNSSAVGYAGVNGSTGNETLLVNVASGQTLTINDEGSGLTYNNTGAGTVNVVSGAVTVRVIAQTGDGTRIQDARVLLKRVSDNSIILSGVTNASGIIEDTAFSYTGDVDVTGWVRKSSASPYYKQGPLSGTITNTGFIGTAILQLDE